MNTHSKFIVLTIGIFVLIILGTSDLVAQCPMCRMSAESNLKDGGTAGAGLNRGILYMLSLPYLLVSTLGILWWRNRRPYSDEVMDEPFSDN